MFALFVASVFGFRYGDVVLFLGIECVAQMSARGGDVHDHGHKNWEGTGVQTFYRPGLLKS